MAAPTPPDGTPRKQPDIRDKALDKIEKFYVGPPRTPQEVGDDIDRVRNLVKVLIGLVIVNLVLTLYVADFVHRIITDLNQL